MRKYILITISIIAHCMFSVQAEDSPAEAVMNNASWHKAVINNNEFYSMLPSKILDVIYFNDHEYRYPRFEETIFLSINGNYSDNPVQYKSNPIRICELGFTYDYYKSFKLYGKNKLIYPYAWDVSDNQKHIITNSMFGRAGMNRTFSHYLGKLGKSSLDPRREGRIHVKLPDYLDYAKQFGESADNSPPPKEIDLSFIEWPKPYEVVYYQINAEMDDIVDVYLLRTNILYKYVFDGNIWTFKYAVRMPRTEPFEAIQKSNNLYILMEKFGIYKIDEFKAVNNSKKTPEVTENISDEYSSIKWSGFTEEDKDLDLIEAEKILDLSYDYYVVDKNSNRGYVIADNYLYEIGNAKRRIKMLEFRETDTFLDAEAERMRATLEAIYYLPIRNEKTPEELLKVTPDSEIDKMLAEKEANNASNSGSGDDIDDSNDKTNAGNGEASVDNDDDSDSKNNSGSSDKNRDDPENSDSALTDNDSNKDNANPANSDKTNISDGTNVLTYVGISAGAIILLTLIFLVLFRKRH